MSKTVDVADAPRDADRSNQLKQAAQVLEDGGVIVAPTETVYGLMTLWDNEAGRKRIYELKQRAQHKPLQMLAYDLDMILAAGVKETPKLRAIADAFWPGPLTVVCPTNDGESVGARIPAESFTRALLNELGKPMAASSANRSGQPTPATAIEASETLTGTPDLVIEGPLQLVGQPSTILSLLEYDPEILRQGTILRGQIIDALRKHGLRR